MVSLYKILSALLSYPTEELQDAALEIAGALQRDSMLSRPARLGLTGLALDLAGSDLIDAQARYVDLFDRSRSLSLHLYEHCYGESRDRGQAMVNCANVIAPPGSILRTTSYPISYRCCWNFWRGGRKKRRSKCSVKRRMSCA